MIHAFIGPDEKETRKIVMRQDVDVIVTDRYFNVYPSRVKDRVVELRKQFSVAIHTNNPLVINELDPDEVTLVTIHDGVVRHTLLQDTKNFKERASVYALGELWLSFCTGELDEPNLTGVE